MAILENPRYQAFGQPPARGALLNDALVSDGYAAHKKDLNDSSCIKRANIDDARHPAAHQRPASAPAAPRGLPRIAPRPPMDLPTISRRSPSHLPGAALADRGSGEGFATASTVVNGDERYPDPRASVSFSVSRSSHASSAAANSSRAASRAVEVRAKAAGSRP
jgi:hypothetical protein